MSKQKVIAFDLDDVICYRPDGYEHLGVDKYNYCMPYMDAVDLVISLYEENFIKIYIDFPRTDLLVRIKERAVYMLDNGAVSEVKKFMKLKVPKVKSANKAIGINEIKEFVKKKIKIEDVIDKISIKTRQYAKRQTTWARGNMSDWNKIKSSGLKVFLKKI